MGIQCDVVDERRSRRVDPSTDGSTRRRTSTRDAFEFGKPRVSRFERPRAPDATRRAREGKKTRERRRGEFEFEFKFESRRRRAKDGDGANGDGANGDGDDAKTRARVFASSPSPFAPSPFAPSPSFARRRRDSNLNSNSNSPRRRSRVFFPSRARRVASGARGRSKRETRGFPNSNASRVDVRRRVDPSVDGSTRRERRSSTTSH